MCINLTLALIILKHEIWESTQTYQKFLPVMHILKQGIAYSLFPSPDTASQCSDGPEALESQLHDTFSLS